MQRVKDIERFLAELERPLPLAPGQPRVVTELELEKDAENFVAFASAFGVRPPRPKSNGDQAAVVPSAPAS